MKISLVLYKRTIKEVDIEFPFYYKSEYLGDGYWDESYVRVLEDGTRTMITTDGDGCITLMKDKIDLRRDIPEELFGEGDSNTTRYEVISQEDFMERYNKLIKEEI